MCVAKTVAELVDVTGLLIDALSRALAAIPRYGIDAFGRVFSGPGLAPPFVAVKVTRSLFHTQRGLNIDDRARVRRQGGGVIVNLLPPEARRLGSRARG